MYNSVALSIFTILCNHYHPPRAVPTGSLPFMLSCVERENIISAVVMAPQLGGKSDWLPKVTGVFSLISFTPVPFSSSDSPHLTTLPLASTPLTHVSTHTHTHTHPLLPPHTNLFIRRSFTNLP